MRYAVIGDPIAHSLSPVMHQVAFAALGLSADYTAVQVPPQELDHFVAKARQELAGFNVTVPHKETLLPLLDEIAPAASAAGSVNTVSNRNGRLYGDSTDGEGLETALREAFGLAPAGSRFVFLGAGGTVRAVVPHLLARGAAAIAVVNRTRDKATALMAKFAPTFPDAELRAIAATEGLALRELVAQATVIVQATSLGLQDGDPSPLAAEYFLPGVCYFDTIYRDTAFLAQARAQACRCADGLGMLLHQGAASFRIWTGHEPPLAAMRQALAAASGRNSVQRDGPLQAPPDEACWRQALRLLQRRMHSRRELGIKLRQRGYSRMVVDAVLQEAERLNLVDDAAFAEAYREELQRKGLGEMRVRVALQRRGVGRPVAEVERDPAASSLARSSERERAEVALARKRTALSRETDPRKRREKLMRFLLSRGFALNLVQEVLSANPEEAATD